MCQGQSDAKAQLDWTRLDWNLQYLKWTCDAVTLVLDGRERLSIVHPESVDTRFVTNNNQIRSNPN